MDEFSKSALLSVIASISIDAVVRRREAGGEGFPQCRFSSKVNKVLSGVDLEPLQT
jgi:hypothetical protein